jgi:hypothetical protein
MHQRLSAMGQVKYGHPFHDVTFDEGKHDVLSAYYANAASDGSDGDQETQFWKLRNMLDGIRWPLPNVHLIATCEDQQRADERIPLLAWCRAAVRGVSLEPLLGPIDLTPQLFVGREGGWEYEGSPRNRLDWVIVGCESGPKRRPCDWHWQVAIVDQCRRAGVPVFVKQISVDVGVGGGRPYHRHWLTRVSKDPTESGGWPADLRVRMFPGEKWQ